MAELEKRMNVGFTGQVRTVITRVDPGVAAKVALVYLFVLTFAEMMTTLINPVIGGVLQAVLLLVIYVHAMLVEDVKLRTFILTLSFAPIIRVLSLSLPLVVFERYMWYFMTGLPLIVTAFMMLGALGYSYHDVALKWRPHWSFLPVASIGFGLGYVEYIILQPEPLVEINTFFDFLIPALVLLIGTGFAEELIFRGIMQRAAIDALGTWSGIILVAIIFAVLHMGYQSVADVVFVFLVGLLFGIIVHRVNNLWGVTFAHGWTNTMLFLIMPHLF